MNEEIWTDAQKRAIDSDAPNIMVIAGPGSGKSTVLVERIRRLVVAGADPAKMVAITFTNQAARELEEKLQFAEQSFPGVFSMPFKMHTIGHVGTLHSFALRMLKEHGSAIGYGENISVISPESADDLLMTKAKALGCKFTPENMRKLKAKGRPVGVRLRVEQVAVATYYDELREAGIVDFDLILTEFARLINTEQRSDIEALFGGFGFTHLFVDEVQDSAAVDWEIYDRLQIENKCYVGDPDQNLYSFRGARVDLMIRKVEEWQESDNFPDSDTMGFEVLRLEANFRSHSEITTAANRLIRRNVHRVEKETLSTKGLGGAVSTLPNCANAGSEIGNVTNVIKDILEKPERYGCAPSEIAIIGRTNAIVRAFQDTLAACGLPVAVEEKHNLPRDWPKTRALIELLVQPENDTLAQFYLTRKMVDRGMGATEARTDAAQAKQFANKKGMSVNEQWLHFPSSITNEIAQILATEEVSLESRMVVAEITKTMPSGFTLMDLALAMATVSGRTEKLTTEGIRCLTIHAAKGLEFDVVFIVGCEQEVIPGNRRDMTPQNVEEERRAMFVAMTRARKRLYFSWAQCRVTPWGAVVTHTESQFIKEALT